MRRTRGLVRAVQTRAMRIIALYVSSSMRPWREVVRGDAFFIKGVQGFVGGANEITLSSSVEATTICTTPLDIM